MRNIDRVRRSTRVIWTVSSIFAGYRRISWTNRRRSPEEAERRLSQYHRRSAERVLAMANELQGLLIKVGQLVGARADVFPDEYIEVLSRLHDTVPPRPFSVMRPVIERELRAASKTSLASSTRHRSLRRRWRRCTARASRTAAMSL